MLHGTMLPRLHPAGGARASVPASNCGESNAMAAGMSAALTTLTMIITTQPFSALELSDLTTVQGGCGGHRRQCCPCPAPAPAQAPAPVVIAAPTQPTGPLVSTNVSVSNR